LVNFGARVSTLGPSFKLLIMKTIKDPEYRHIKKLLESTNSDDVLVGVHLLAHSEISDRGLLKSFPCVADPTWDFYNKSDLNKKWCEIGGVDLVINGEWIYAITREDRWYIGHYQKIEI